MRGSFSIYLRRAGLTLGPSLRCTRHSDLSTLKAFLIGGFVSFGYKAHNNFGSSVHATFLENKTSKHFLTPEERAHKQNMIATLRANPIVKQLLAACHTFEVRRGAKLNGVKLKYTPDGHGKKIIIDLKTTRCSSARAFFESAIKYGYFRQGKTYMLCLGLKEYWIIGIQKERPYKVYLICITDPRNAVELRYAELELEFLLYFYKHYGNPNWKAINRTG